MFHTMVRELKELLANKDIETLANKYEESHILDFKINQPLASTDNKPNQPQKYEFAADVASFANTSGGILVYGVQEEKGIPKAILPFDLNNLQKGVDTLKNQLGQTLRTWIEPPLHGYQFEAVPIGEKFCFIIIIPKSFSAPHGVKAPDKEHYHFFGRKPEGSKYQYKYHEIKNAFSFRDRLSDKIKLFREHRINKIINNEVPLPLLNNPKIVLHLMPLSAFETNQTYHIEKFYDNRKLLTPIYNPYQQSTTQRRNFDGILFHNHNDTQGKYDGYIQFYRNGIIESVDAMTISDPVGEEPQYLIPSRAYEKDIILALKNYMQAIDELKIQPPLLLALSFFNIKGYRMALNQWEYPHIIRYPIDQDILILSETEITDITQQPHTLLKPSFDLVWNACGLKGSFNYDDEGNFLHPQMI